MNVIFKLNNLYNKNDAQLNKEMSRRGLQYDGKTKVDKICEIIAYDAYNAGRSNAFEKVRKNIAESTVKTQRKNTAESTAKERSCIVLNDNANDTVAFLKVTECQMDMLDYLIDHDWLTDVSYTKTEQIGWNEP